MLGALSVKGESKKLKEFQAGIKHAFSKVKNELDDHLDSINHSTQEIQTLYDYLGSLDAKIDKLNERIDEMQMLVNPKQENQFSAELTNREQEVFLVLYAEEQVTNKEIAKKLGFTEEMVNKYIYNLIAKGIPVLREYQNEQIKIYLDLKFKDLQARKNVLNINEGISKEVLTEKMI